MSDRKYRQRGYQDSGPKERERSERSTPRPPGPRDDSRGPRGRGLGAPTETVFKCAACGTQLPAADEVAARCPRCGADLHTCSHCSHFDSAVFNECRQGGALPPGATTPVRVAKKTQRNDCTLFAPRSVQVFAKEEKRSPDDPRAAFDALFKI